MDEVKVEERNNFSGDNIKIVPTKGRLKHYAQPVTNQPLDEYYRTIESDDFPNRGFTFSCFISPQDAEKICVAFNTHSAIPAKE